MTYIVGRGVRVEMSIAGASTITVTAITQAFPAVATSAAHGLSNKTVGHLSGVDGMVQLDFQAVRVASVATNTFQLEDIDTTLYPAFSGSCFFTAVTSWVTIGNATSYSIGGGEGDQLDISVLLDDIKQTTPGLLAAQTVTFNIRSETISGTGMAKVRQFARLAQGRVFRITTKDGNVRFFWGIPSIPGEQVDQGAVGTGTFSVTVRGFVCEGAA